MGRQGGDHHPTVVSSSIALLQERFRQLHKVREKREKKELLKLLSESEHVRFSSQPETVVLSRIPDNIAEDSLSLGLNSPGRHAAGFPTSTSFWSNGAAASSSASKSPDNSDVDTSLHL